jgi:hypothetical protein
MTYIDITVRVPAEVPFKAAGFESTVDVAKLAAEAPDSLMRAIIYGLRRILQDKLNASAAKTKEAGGRWDARKEGEFYLEKLYANEWSTAAGDSGDPVAAMAVNIALDEILRIAGCANRAELAKHDKGRKYVKVSDKGAITPNVGAIVEWLKANDEKLNITERAKAIVAAKATVEVEGDIAL